MTGLLKDSFDARHHFYVPELTAQRPRSVNLRQGDACLTLEIYDQLKTGSCTANATAAAFWYEEMAGNRGEVWGKAGPSRLFIYWLARGAYNHPSLNISWPSDSGCSVRDAMRGIAKCGVYREINWPFDITQINRRPPHEAFEKAKPHRIDSFYRLDPQRPYYNDVGLSTEEKDQMGAAVLENPRQCLAERHPVVFEYRYFLPSHKSFDESQTPFVLKDVWALQDKKFPRHTFPENLPDELRIRGKARNLVTAGHTVLAIGYDDDKEAVLIQNSLGPEWGGEGTFWMPYSWITDCGATYDFWTIRCTKPETPCINR